VAANRNNAMKSTGPRTAEGKQRSSQNALRTGIYARRWLVPAPGPERRMFEDLLARLETEFPAEDLLDEQLHEDFAVGRLRVWRDLAAETGDIMAEQARAAELEHTDSLYGLLVNRPTEASLAEMLGAVQAVREQLKSFETLSPEAVDRLARVLGALDPCVLLASALLKRPKESVGDGSAPEAAKLDERLRDVAEALERTKQASERQRRLHRDIARRQANVPQDADRTARRGRTVRREMRQATAAMRQRWPRRPPKDKEI